MTKNRLKQVLDEALQWVKGDFGLHEMLRSQYSALPLEKDTIAWSTEKNIGASYALLHLGALALLGDVVTLCFYQRSFAAGDHLGFNADTESATLDESHLERALLMAEEVTKTEQLSYAVLERVAEKLSMKVNHYRYFRVRDPNLCNEKRALHREGVEWKKQQLREQGAIVCDEEVMFNAGGREVLSRYCHS